MKIRLLVVLAAVIAFSVVGAGWKWQKQAAPSSYHAGWSWDGNMGSSISGEAA